MTTTDFRDLKNSVKRDDYGGDGRVVYLLIPQYDADYAPLPYDLPPEPILRDTYLRASIKAEALWACAVGIATTKMASISWEVESVVPLRAKRAQDLFLHADSGHPGGGGWVRYTGRLTKDYLTQNNGTFSEIERYGRAHGARIKAIHHLDSARCRRTGDPEFPVVYTDLKGAEHAMRWWQVISFADLPETAAEKLGQGFCAANRAWRKICLLSSIERYVFEKVSGRKPLSMYFVGGLLDSQLKDAIKAAQASASQQGMQIYMGAAIAPVRGDTPVTVVEIPLAALPDRFDPEKERAEASLIYANAIGLDPQDLRPISNQQMGAGAQSQVLDEKAEGRGLSALRKDMVHQFSEFLLDDKSTFFFSEEDMRDIKMQAEVSDLRAKTRGQMIQNGEIQSAQSLQMAVDAGDAPREFIPEDGTPTVGLHDEEKPVTEEEEEAGQGDTDPEQEAEGIVEKAKKRRRARRSIRAGDVFNALSDEDILKRARALADEATGGQSSK